MILITLLFMTLFSYIIGVIIFGGGSDSFTVLTSNATTRFVDPLTSLYFKSLSNIFLIWISVTICFTLSLWINSALIAVGFSLSFQILSNTISIYLERFSWFKFTPFSNLDLSLYLENQNNNINGLSLEQSLFKGAIYLLLSIFLSFSYFRKKEF